MGKRSRRRFLARSSSSPILLPAAPALPAPWIESSSSSSKSHFMYSAPAAPSVFYTDEAWAKMQLTISHCQKEVGWVGLVERHGKNNFLITDIFVPSQEVTGATTNIDPNALIELVDQLTRDGLDPDKLRYWGHSHVTMDVTPSVTDERQVQEYVESIGDNDFFIRGIYNKQGNSKVDVYIKHSEDMGWIHECVHDQRIAPTFTNTTTFLAGIDAVVRTPPPPPTAKKTVDKSYKRNVSNTRYKYDHMGNMYDCWDQEDLENWERGLHAFGDLGMISPDAEQALLQDLGVDEEDIIDPFHVASGS